MCPHSLLLAVNLREVQAWLVGSSAAARLILPLLPDCRGRAQREGDQAGHVQGGAFNGGSSGGTSQQQCPFNQLPQPACGEAWGGSGGDAASGAPRQCNRCCRTYLLLPPTRAHMRLMLLHCNVACGRWCCRCMDGERLLRSLGMHALQGCNWLPNQARKGSCFGAAGGSPEPGVCCIQAGYTLHGALTGPAHIPVGPYGPNWSGLSSLTGLGL
jgi:hypothetical protein